MANPLASINQPSDAPHPGMIWIPGGTFLMGSDKHYPEEAPAHRAVHLDGVTGLPGLGGPLQRRAPGHAVEGVLGSQLPSRGCGPARRRPVSAGRQTRWIARRIAGTGG